MTNPSFKDNIVKVGQTTDPERRRKELFQATGVPSEFKIYALMRTTQYKEVEIALHHILEKVVHNKVNKAREFFQIDPEEAFFLMKQLEPFIEDAEITLGSEFTDVFEEPAVTKKKIEKAESISLESYAHYKECKHLYDDLKNLALELEPEAQIVYKKMYVAFKKKTNFMDVVFLKRGCVLYFNIPYAAIKGTSAETITEDVSQKGHWDNGEVLMHVPDLSHLEEIRMMAAMALERQKK